MFKNFSNYLQPDSKDCGATCIKIIAKHFGKVLNIQTVRILSETTREGANLLNLSDAIEQIGFKSIGVKISLNKLLKRRLNLQKMKFLNESRFTHYKLI